MTKKKQQYIYVARNKKSTRHIVSGKIIYHISNKKMKLLNDVFEVNKKFCITPKQLYEFFGIKLKKGEQVRIPIDTDKAERVE